MKTLYITLLFSLLLGVLFSCKSENKNKETSENTSSTAQKKSKKDISLSTEVKNAFRKSAVQSCACIEKHSTLIKKSVSEIKSLLLDAEKNKAQIDSVKRYKEIKSGFAEFEDCMRQTHPSKSNADLEKKIKEDFRSIAGKEIPKKVENKMRKTLILDFMQSQCPEHWKTLVEFRNLGEEVQKNKLSTKNISD
jgi:hypothetical protein